MRTIIKYKNRKYYELGGGKRSYTTLRGLLSLINQRETFRVVDHRSKADITHRVLGNVLTWVHDLQPQERNEIVRLLGEV